MKRMKHLEKVRKLNIEDNKDKDILSKIISESISLSKLYIENNTSLIMFYCMDFMKDDIYYIEDYDVVAICEYNEEIVYLKDIFATKEVNLDKVSNALMQNKTKKVLLGFTPNNTLGYEESLVNEEDTTLFIRSRKDIIFKKDKLMFPILSHA